MANRGTTTALRAPAIQHRSRRIHIGADKNITWNGRRTRVWEVHAIALRPPRKASAARAVKDIARGVAGWALQSRFQCAFRAGLAVRLIKRGFDNDVLGGIMLKTENPFPDFSLPNHDGNTRSLRD